MECKTKLTVTVPTLGFCCGTFWWTHHAVGDEDFKQSSGVVSVVGRVQGELRHAQRQHVARLHRQRERLGLEGRLAMVLFTVELPL